MGCARSVISFWGAVCWLSDVDGGLGIGDDGAELAERR